MIYSLDILLINSSNIVILSLKERHSMGKSKGNSYILKTIGNNVKKIRLSRGITQEQMAERLNRSINFVSLIELGKSGMSVETIVDICNILNVSSESLFKGLINYNSNEKDRYILENISTLNNKDKQIVTDLMQYIIENRGN